MSDAQDSKREPPPVTLPSDDAPRRAASARDAPRTRARGDAQEVEGTEGGTPVLVEFEGEDGKPPRRARLVTKGEGMTLAPDTTEEDDRVTKEQRRISAVWEVTQATISITITIAVIYCQLNDISSETLNNAFFFVIATYLQRTNHTRVGGAGDKAGEPTYKGR